MNTLISSVRFRDIDSICSNQNISETRFCNAKGKHLINSMGQERLSGIALLNIEKEFEINME